MDDAGIRRLTGDTGVFVGGDSDLQAAKVRYEAMQAVKKGTATHEQRQLLNDLDRVMQRARGRQVEAPRANQPPRRTVR